MTTIISPFLLAFLEGSATGVGITVTPCTDCPIELEVADDDGTGLAPDETTAASLGTISAIPLGTTRRLVDLNPLDGKQRWYRSRHVCPGFPPSPWNNWVCATPAIVEPPVDGPVNCDNIVIDCELAKTEFCSTDGSGDEDFHTYGIIPIASFGLVPGTQFSWQFQGKVTATGTAGPPGAPTGGNETNPEGTLKRTTFGLLFFDNFFRADGAPGSDWTIHSGGFTIIGGALVPTGAGLIEASNFTSRADMFVQARTQRISTAQTYDVVARYAGGASLDGYGYNYALLSQMRRFDNNVPTNLGSSTGITCVIAVGNCASKIGVDGSNIRGNSGGGFGWITEEIDATYATGKAGWRVGAGTPLLVSFLVSEGTLVQVTNLPTGATIQVGNGSGTESGGTATADTGGQSQPYHTLIVRDSAGVILAEITPSHGIFGGDIFNYDSAGGQSDTSGTDLEAAIDMRFLDSAGATLSTTDTRGSETPAYSRVDNTATVPAGAVSAIPIARRKGGGAGIACVQFLQINAGPTACVFSCTNPTPAQRGTLWRVPTDEDLVTHLSFDHYKFVRADRVTASGSTGVCLDDPDGTIALSRIEWDSSVNQNHFKAITNDLAVSQLALQAGFGDGDVTEGYYNVWQPAPGVSGWGRLLPEWSIFPQKWAYRNSATYYLDKPEDATIRGPFDIVEGFSMTWWHKPTLNGFVTIPFAGMHCDGCFAPQTVNAGFRVSGHIGQDLGGGAGPRYRITDVPGLGSPIRLQWDADPAWGEIDTGGLPAGKARDVGDLATAFTFYGLTVSPVYQIASVDVQDIRMWMGNSITGEFFELTDDLLITPNGSYRSTAIGFPAIEPFDSSDTRTRFGFAAVAVEEQDVEQCEHNWDPGNGVYDEFRRYNRVLDEFEIEGLFRVPSGQHPTHQTCPQIIDDLDGHTGIGNEDQELCEGPAAAAAALSLQIDGALDPEGEFIEEVASIASANASASPGALISMNETLE